MNGIDTNVLVYAFDFSEPVKQPKAQRLLDDLQAASAATVPWQVVGEFLNCLRRWQQQGRISASDVDAHIDDLLEAFPIALPTVNVVRVSLDLMRRHSLSHWDSMLIAACIDAGMDTLYSEDLSDGAVYDSVRVLNPFV
jgi:predicted nucleic acid-binding protein